MRFRTRRGARLSSRLNTIEPLESRTLLSAQMDANEWLGENMVDTSYTRLHLRAVTQESSPKQTLSPQTNVATTGLSALSQPAPVPPSFLESLRIVSNADGTSAAIIDYRGTEPGVYNAAVRWDGGPAEDIPVDQPGEFWHEPTIGSAYAFREHLSPGEHTLALTVSNASTGAHATTSAVFTIDALAPQPADESTVGPEPIASGDAFEASGAPQVAAVYVSGSAWSSSFKNYLQAQGIGHSTYGYAIDAGDQLNELPWVNLNTVSVRFSEHVEVSQADLLLVGVNAASYTAAGITYDSATYTATWTLNQPIPKDNILLHVSNTVTDGEGQRLDGEWVNGADTFNSGNDQPDGPFDFRLNVLPGDADRDGDVDDVDAAAVRARFFRSTSNPGTTNPYTAFHDMDGNGTIVAGDFAEATRPDRVGPGMGDAEPPTTSVTLPASPGGMTAAALAHDHVELFWEDQSSNETGFRIERRTGAGAWSSLGTAGSGVTRYADRDAVADTEYEYRIAAACAAGLSQYAGTTASTPSEPQSSTTPFAAPTLSAEDLNNGTIRLTWVLTTAVLEMAAEDENFHPADVDVYVEDGIAAADYEDAQPNHEYRFRLRVDNTDGGWAYSNEVTVLPNLLPGLAGATDAYQVPGMQVSVFWIAEKDRQDGFKVFGRKLPDGAVQPLGTAGRDETSLTVPVGSPGHWTFEVLAYNNLVQSPEPAPDFHDPDVTVYVLPNASAPTPDLLSADLEVDEGEYQAELSMNGNYDTVVTDWGTNIEQSWNGRDFFFAASTFADYRWTQTYDTDPLVLGTTNTFRLHNADSDGVGAASETISVTVPGPSAPVGLAAAIDPSGNVQLTWSHGERQGTGYIIERAPAAGAFTELKRVQGTVYTDDATPVPGAQYTYRVTTLSRAGPLGHRDITPSDAYSESVSVSIYAADEAPTAPTGLEARAYDGGGVDLRWDDNSAFEEGFRIRRTDLTDPTGGTEVTGEVDEDVAQFHDTQNLIPGHSYRYSVVAFSSGGETLSNTVTVTPLPFSGVWIEAIDPNAAEAGPNPGRFIVWRGGPAIDRPLTVNYDLSGTATRGTDYGSPGSNASIPADYYGQVVEVTPVLDTVPEATETVDATVAPGGYTFSSGDPVTVNIAHVGLFEVDLDIDSDNDNGFDPPARTEAEDRDEDVANDAAKPGKIIAVTDDDTDGDGIIDWADGFDRDELASTGDEQTLGERFVPMILQLPQGTDFSNVKVRFLYEASDPLRVEQGSSDPFPLFPSPEGTLRIWTVDGGGSQRDARTVTAGGDFVHKDQPYTAAQLGVDATTGITTLFVEGIKPSTSPGDQRIQVEIDVDGDGPAGYSASDALRLSTLPLPDVTAGEDAVDRSDSFNSRLIWSGGLYATSFRIERLSNDGVTWTSYGTVNNIDHAFTPVEHIEDVAGVTEELPDGRQDGTICSWRIVSINPAGATVGLPFRNHVGNDPLPGNAFSVFAMKRVAFSAMQSEEMKHRGRTYYRPAGVDSLYNQLSAALETVSVQVDNNLPATKSAEYADILNEIKVRSAPTGIAVTHELVHAWDDLKDWYITALADAESAEALAYATEYLLAAAEDGLGHLSRMDTLTFADATAAQQSWSFAWQNIGAVVGSMFEWDDGVPLNGNPSRALTAADVADVAAKLGLRFSVGSLLSLYNAMLTKKGLPSNSLSNSFNFTVAPCFA